MSETVVFNWKYCKKNRSTEHYELLKATHNIPLTENQFIEVYRKYYPGRVGLSRPKGLYKNLKQHLRLFPMIKGTVDYHKHKAGYHTRACKIYSIGKGYVCRFTEEPLS